MCWTLTVFVLCRLCIFCVFWIFCIFFIPFPKTYNIVGLSVVFLFVFVFLDPAYRISYSETFCHHLFKNISQHRCLSFSLYLSLSVYLCLYLYLYLSMYLNFCPNFDSWHQGLSENIRFEGSLRPDGSVSAHLWTQENCCGWTDGRVDGNRRLYKRSSRT